MRILTLFATVGTTILDFIFPPNEEKILVRSLTDTDLRKLSSEEILRGVVTLSEFQAPAVRALIHEAKFHGNQHAFRILGLLLAQHLEKHQNTYDCIIPIPLSRRRRRERGYNQVQEVIRTIELPPSIRFIPSVLSRTRDTKPQTELSRIERLGNLTDAFAVTDPTLVRGKRILVVDDVLTTGATLRAAEIALQKHGPASVTLLALAH